MTWTPAVETNLDFESATIPSGPNPDWTVDRGTPRYSAQTVDGGTVGFKGGSSESTTVISRALALPANAKKVRLTAWLGRDNADGDQCCAVLYLYNASSEIIGGVSVGSIDNNTSEQQEYVVECLVPADTDSVKLEVSAIRVGGSANNAVCASTAVEWFIDSGLTVYKTPTFIINGGFEVGDSPPTGWEHVSGNGLVSTTGSDFVFAGTYGARAEQGDTQISQQSVFNVPDNAESLYFYGVAMPNATDSGDRLRMRLLFYDEFGVELDELLIWGQCGDIRPVPMTLTATSIPATTATIRARAEFFLATGSGVNVGFDVAELVFTSDSGPIDTTPKVRVRRENNTWFTLNPVFRGADEAGLVPDPSTEENRYLRDDGTWQVPPGGGGAVDSVNGQTGVVVLDADDISDAATANKFATASELADIALNTADRHVAVSVTDSPEIDFTLTGQDITASIVAGSLDESKLDVSVNASLDLADTALQDVVDDTTPTLGGNLDADNKELNNVDRIDIVGTGMSYAALPSPFISYDTDYTTTYTGVLPLNISVSNTITAGDGTIFGQGAMFANGVTITNPSGVVRTQGGYYTLLSQPTYQADNAALTPIGQADILSQGALSAINGGSSSMTFWQSYTANLAVGGNCILNDRVAFAVRNHSSGAGTIEGLTGFATSNYTRGNTTNVDVSLGSEYPYADGITGNWGIYQSHQKPNKFNGSVRYPVRAVTGGVATTLNDTDFYTYVIGGAGATTITLPVISSNRIGMVLIVKNYTASTVTVAAGAGNLLLPFTASVTIAANGSRTFHAVTSAFWGES